MSRTYFCRDVDDNFFGIIYNMAGYRARRGGSTKKEKGPSWDGFSIVLGQCVEYNMADHHIPLTHMVWIWGRMDCPDG